jgi:predicted permease
MILGATFGNVTYLGLPILLETFPKATEQAAEVSVLFEVTKSTLNLTLGAMIAIHFGSHEAITFRKTVFEALKLPPIWALIVAILMKYFQISCPGVVLETAKLLSSTVSGLMMLSLGMALQFRINPLVWLVIPVALLKLIVAPLLMSRIVTLYGINDVYGSATIIEAAMPSQLLSFVISSRFELDDETLSIVIMADTLLAFLTLPWVTQHLALVS